MFVCLFVCLFPRLVSSHLVLSRFVLCCVVLGYLVLFCPVCWFHLIIFYNLSSLTATLPDSEAREGFSIRKGSTADVGPICLFVDWLPQIQVHQGQEHPLWGGMRHLIHPIALRCGVVWLGQRSTNMAVKGLEMRCAKTWSLHIVFLVTGFNSVSSLSELDHQNAPPLPGEQRSCHGQALVQTAQEIRPRRS